MTWLLLYLGVGLLNVAHAGVGRRLVLTTKAKRRAGDHEWVSGTIEAAFYVLLWPLQVLWFVVFACIPNAIEWLHTKITGA